jgi:hypothetical protein
MTFGPWLTISSIPVVDLIQHLVLRSALELALLRRLRSARTKTYCRKRPNGGTLGGEANRRGAVGDHER